MLLKRALSSAGRHQSADTLGHRTLIAESRDNKPGSAQRTEAQQVDESDRPLTIHGSEDLRCSRHPRKQEREGHVKRMMALLTLGVLALGLAPSVGVAQNAVSDTVYSGIVFYFVNDIGKPPFIFDIVRDSLRVQSSESSYPDGYPIWPGMRRTAQIDSMDRNPPPPDPFDTAARAYERELRLQPNMTQRKLIEAMAAYYRTDASVDSVFIEPGDASIGAFKKQYRGQGFPTYYGFSLIPPPHGAYPDGRSLYDPLQDQKNVLAGCVRMLTKYGILVIGDGGSTGALYASREPQIRELLKHGGPSAVANWLAEDRTSGLLPKLFRYYRPLPGLP